MLHNPPPPTSAFLASSRCEPSPPHDPQHSLARPTLVVNPKVTLPHHPLSPRSVLVLVPRSLAALRPPRPRLGPRCPFPLPLSLPLPRPLLPRGRGEVEYLSEVPSPLRGVVDVQQVPLGDVLPPIGQRAPRPLEEVGGDLGTRCDEAGGTGAGREREREQRQRETQRKRFKIGGEEGGVCGGGLAWCRSR